MTESSVDRDPLDRLAEEFLDRYRRGERPSLSEYCQRLPDRADEVRDLFPALVEMEQLKPGTGEHTGAFAPAAEPTDPTRVGEFRILRRVGQGGMGVVYEAVQESLGRRVALKLLPVEALADRKRLERFRREARAAGRLHHTNIVPVFGVGEADGRHYFAMQFIDGHPLDAVIEEVKRLKEKSAAGAAVPRAVSRVAASLMSGSFARVAPRADSAEAPSGAASTSLRSLPASAQTSSSPALSGTISEGGRHYWTTVAKLCAQVADALAYAHAQDILHRDIKPANLLLDLHGTTWVTDFGLAKSTEADNLTHVGDVVGTLRYMAPERFEGQGDHRADIYALGLTLYELLTLRPAFKAKNRAKLIEQVIASNPRRPRSIDRNIPRDLETIALKATARDPAQRYASAAAMAADLRRYLEDRPIMARRATVREQTVRWCRRNPAVAALMAAVVLVLASGAGVAAYFAVKANDKAVEAEAKAREAGEQTKKAQEEQERSRRSLVQLSVRAGSQAFAASDPLAALLWYEHAWQLDRDNAAGAPSHRLRIAALLEQLPDLVGCCFHPEQVVDADLSPDGTRVLSVTATGRAFLWDPVASRLVCPALKHTGIVKFLRFSANGASCATAGGAHVHLWDGKTGAAQAAMKHAGPVTGLAFRPDGKRVAVAAGGKVWIWDAATGRPSRDAFDANLGPDHRLGYSPDGTRLVVAGENMARVWDAESGLPVTEPFAHVRPRFQFGAQPLPVFTANASGIVASTAAAFIVHPLRQGFAPRSYVRTQGDVRAIALSPDGRWAAHLQVNPLIWDVLRGSTVVLPAHPRAVGRAEFSADGSHFATLTGGDLVRVWAVQVNRFVKVGPPLKGSRRACAIRFSRDNRRLMIGDHDGTVRVWDLRPREQAEEAYVPDPDEIQPLRPQPLQAPAKVLEPRAKTAWKLEGTVSQYYILNRDTGKRVPLRGNMLGTVVAYDVSADGRRLATCHTTGDVRVWDPETGELVAPPMPHAVDVASLGFSPDGRWLFTFTFNQIENWKQQSQVWDAETGELLVPAFARRVCGFTRDGNRLIVEKENGLYVAKPLPRLSVDLDQLAPLGRLLAGRQLYGHLGVDAIPMDTFVDDPATHRRAWLAWRELADDAAAQPSMAPLGDPPSGTLQPGEAAAAVGHTVTVEMTIARVVPSKTGNWLNLHATAPKEPGDFTLAVREATAERRKALGLDRPDAELVGLRVRASGRVTLFSGRPEIVIDRPDQMQILEP